MKPEILTKTLDKVRHVKALARTNVGTVPSRKVFVDKKSKKPKYPHKYDEDFSLKPASSTDVERRKVNEPDPNRHGLPGGGYSFDKKGHDEKVKRSGKSQGPYKAAVVASKHAKSSDITQRTTDKIHRQKYKDTLKKKGIKVEGIMDFFKKKEQKPERPHPTQYDRHHDVYDHELPEFKPEWMKYSSKNKDVKKEETEIKDPLAPRDEKWFKTKGKEQKKNEAEINRDRLGYGDYAGAPVKESAPPGFEGTVKTMKKHKDISNPFALAWSMKKKGFKSHIKEAAVPDTSTFKQAVARQMAQKNAPLDSIKNRMDKIDNKYKRISSITSDK